jgi:hypothetical protein
MRIFPLRPYASRDASLSIVGWVAAGGASVNRTFRRAIRCTGVLQAELGYRTRVIGQVRCTDVRQQKS